MGLFNKQKESNKNQHNQDLKKISLSELDNDILSNISGGKSYYNEQAQLDNENYIKRLVNSR